MSYSWLIGLVIFVGIGVGVYLYIKRNPNPGTPPQTGQGPKNFDPKG